MKAKRAEGGVSVMTWISLIGITLAVFALVATLSVRSGFRTEIVDTILGANSHITLYKAPSQDQYGNVSRTFKDYDEIASNLLSLPSVKGSAPLIRSQIMATFDNRNTGLEVFGISYDNLLGLDRIANPEEFEENGVKGFTTEPRFGIPFLIAQIKKSTKLKTPKYKHLYAVDKKDLW